MSEVVQLVVLVPLAASVLLAAVRVPDRVAKAVWVLASAAVLVLVVVLALGWDSAPAPDGFRYQTRLRWIPSVGAGWHTGLDGLSLPLVGLTAGLFLACSLYALRETRRPRTLAALFLFLESTCLALFAALDLLVFFVAFDLSLVAMYLVIAGWGTGRAATSALQFFLYTFVGSLALLVGFLGLFVASAPHTFDIVELTGEDPFAGRPVAGGLVLMAIGLGLAVKTPTFPFHTWLPPAHSDAPAVGSAVLAGVLLKLGTYGFVRIAMPLLPQAWRQWAWLVVVVGVVSVLWGVLVALAQTDLKRLVAYTSITHMGYVVLAVGAAGMVGADERVRAVAVSGAVTQMVSHGLVTGALFLLTGVLHERGGTYDMAAYGGLAHPLPRFSAALVVASLASLGLPGFSGFAAEFQIFAGSLGPAPVATVIASTGIVLTAALFLLALQKLLFGEPAQRAARWPDLRAAETAAVVPLLALSVAVGVVPRLVLHAVAPAAATLAALVAR